MALELYLYHNTEVYKLDVDDLDLSTVLAVENIRDIETRKDNITKDVVLRGSRSNNIAFGFLDNISRMTLVDHQERELGVHFIPNSQVNCSLFEHNIEILKGKLMVNTVEVKEGVSEYNCTIVGDVVSFFRDLSDRYLHELDYFEKVWDAPIFDFRAIRSSWTNAYSAYVYPQIDYGEKIKNEPHDEYTTDFPITNYRPAFYLNRYLMAIFAGFRYDAVNKKYTQFNEDGSLVNKYALDINDISPIIDKAFIPNNDEYFATDRKGQQLDRLFKGVVISGSDNLNKAFTLSGCLKMTTPNFDETYLETTLADDYVVYDRDGTKITNDATVLHIKNSYYNSTLTITTGVRLPSNAKGTWYVGLATFHPERPPQAQDFKYFKRIGKEETGSQIIPVEIKLDAQNIAGKYVMAYYREDQSTNNVNTSPTDVFSIRDVELTIGDTSTVTRVSVIDGVEINGFNYIPKNIKITDFLKSIMTMFNLYLFQNTEGKFTLQTYKKFYENVLNYSYENIVDWSEKMDWGNYKLSTNIGLPDGYNFKFAEDEDSLNTYYKEKYSDTYGNYSVKDKNGVEDAKNLEVMFASTINISTSKNPINMPHIYQNDGFLTGEKKPFHSKIRVLFNNGIQNVNFDIWARAQPWYINQTEANYCSMFKFDNGVFKDSLVFGLPYEVFTRNDIPRDQNLTLYSQFQEPQIKELINPELMILDANMDLNEEDIANLDFRYPVFISSSEYGQGIFKVLEIDYKNSRTLSKVKLQKVVI